MAENKLWDGFKILLNFLKKVGAFFEIPQKVYVLPYIFSHEYKFVEAISSHPLPEDAISAFSTKNVSGRNGTVEKTKLDVVSNVAVNANRGDGLWVYHVLLPKDILDELKKKETYYVLTVYTFNRSHSRYAHSSVKLTGESFR